MDGTPVNLFQRPHIHGEDWWTRKSRYSMNLQLVCDHKKRIRAMLIGWPGSVYDSDVFGFTPYVKNPKKYFSDGEFLISDAGYALLEYLCTPYRQPAASLEENELFNHLFSKGRVFIEHVNGILKSRFGSLKGIRINVSKVEDFERVNEWVLVCLILHNILMIHNDDSEFEVEESDDDDDEEDEDYIPPSDTAEGLNLRSKVQEYMLKWWVDKKDNEEQFYLV